MLSAQFDINAILANKTQHNIQQAGQQFNPYEDNGGTVLAIGGHKFFLIACDSRLSRGYSILARNVTKIKQLKDNCYLASSGQYADFTALCKMLDIKLKIYEYNNQRVPKTNTIFTLLSRTLYMKRFFPYYTFNLACGFDENDNGIVAGYDAIGSYDVKHYAVQGSAQAMMIPILDCQLEGYNQIDRTLLTSKEDLIKLIIDCFNAATDRDIYTGDSVEIICVEKDKAPVKTYHKLRRD